MTDVTIDKDIETILGYRFNNRELLEQALQLKLIPMSIRVRIRMSFAPLEMQS